jgi:hypothetical protein
MRNGFLSSQSPARSRDLVGSGSSGLELFGRQFHRFAMVSLLTPPQVFDERGQVIAVLLENLCPDFPYFIHDWI